MIPLRPLSALCLVATLHAPAATHAAPSTTLVRRPAAAPVLPSVTIAVHRDRILFNEMSVPVRTAYPLVEAIRLAPPGSNPVFGIYGDISRPNSQAGSMMQIGGGDSNLKDYVAHWGAKPMRFAVIGMTPDARIREFDLRDHMNNGQRNGGVLDCLFANLTIEARFSRCVGAPQGHRFGTLRLYKCRFVGSREGKAAGNHGGFGMQWGIRAMARGTWDVRDCHFEPVEEHCWYIDSPRKVNRFIGNTMDGAGRTMGQIVNRSVANPGPSGTGTLVFEANHARGIWGDGGSAFTVAGFLGDVILHDNVVTASSASHGAVAVWTDETPAHGTYLNPAGYSTNRVFIRRLAVNAPQADRDHVAISGVEEVSIQGFVINGNRTAISLEDPRGGSIPNGTVRFEPPTEHQPLSEYAGFLAENKIKLRGTILSDEEIDLRWPIGGGPGGSASGPPEGPGRDKDSHRPYH